MKNDYRNTPDNWKQEFAELFRRSLSYINEQRRYIYAVALVFVASTIVGFVFADYFSFFDDILKEIVDRTGDLDYLEMIWFIFSNNITSSLFALLLGLFFGVFPFFSALFNGSLLGYVYSKTAIVGGYGVIWRLLPHGIFELPAILISFGLGIHFGMALFGRHKRAEIVYRWKRSMQAFLTVVFILLAIAAVVESTLITFAG